MYACMFVCEMSGGSIWQLIRDFAGAARGGHYLGRASVIQIGVHLPPFGRPVPSKQSGAFFQPWAHGRSTWVL